MKYLLIVKEDDELPAEGFVWDHLNPEHTAVENIQAIHQWHQMAVTILSDSSDSTITNYLNMWMNENRWAKPFPKGTLLWWTRREEPDHEPGTCFPMCDACEDRLQEREAFGGNEMREENFGPVTNPDGTPTEFTRQMLEGTGRSLRPPFGPVTVISAEGTGQGMLHDDDHIEMLTAEQGRLEGEYGGEDQHLEEAYEDRYVTDDLD